MNNVKGFILGFGLSVLGVSMYSNSSSATQTQYTPQISNVKIELFKQADTLNNNVEIAHNIKKETFSKQIFTPVNDIENIQTEEDTKETNLALDFDNINGIEDEEILSINTDDIIPIEFNTKQTQEANLLYLDNSEKVAMLPTDISAEDDTFEETNSPWVIAKSGKDNNKIDTSDTTNFQISTSIDNNKIIQEDLSFEVAKRIKQNIIFPIPDEILNDENLTPTFITQKKTENTDQPKQLKIIEKKKVESSNDVKSDNTFTSNISSWLGNNSNTPAKETPKKKTKATPPIYTTQETTNTKQTTRDIGNFYEALQKTKSNHNKNNITPTELKLSFNQERAEISGQTLRWLKAFSEKALEENYYLQVKLNASTPTDLQRKRLNLLYTIFINNGLDIEKIDTKFSNIEPNTFIIRTQKLTTTNN